jgi:hypothetical protein
MANKVNNYSKRTKMLFLGFFLFLGFTSLFGQEMMWSTISGTNIRHIPLNNVKAEILKISTQFSFFWLDVDSPFISRARLRAGSPASALENPAYRYQTQMFLSWIDNNQNFVYATRTQIHSLRTDSVVITIVNGDRVYQLSFHTSNSTGNEYSTYQNRAYIDNILNSWLSGMVSQHSANPVAINSFNIRIGEVTRAAPTINNRDYDRAKPVNRFSLLPSTWFNITGQRLGINENQLKLLMADLGITNTEQTLIIYELKRSGAVIFYYQDRNNKIRFIHSEIE